MRNLRLALTLALAVAVWQTAFLVPARGQATTGSVDFVVLVTPTGGRPEAGLRIPVFLLQKSFTDIQKEAEKETPAPDLEKFVDGLDVSAELKAWMKKNKTARLNGADFVRQLSADDILGVPEFYEAYLARNAPDVAVGFPKPKFKETDPVKNPQKYEQQVKEYKESVKKHLRTFAHTKEGIELHLTTIDPFQKWSRLESERGGHMRLRAQQLAQTRYLLAKTETDLQGRGSFIRVTPGEFWLSTLEHEALAGDMRLRWDHPVSIRPGVVTQVELSNVNAAPRARRL
jgi:hypothetical protein